MSAVFTFDEALHEYRVDGVRLPSVTQLLAPIKPDFSMVSPDVLEAKRSFGVAVHLACELDDRDELDDAGTDERVLACVAAWRKFKAETGAAVILNEQRLYHPLLRFAGTVDRLLYARLRNDPAASAWLVDLKTGIDPHPSFGVQLSGYAMLITHGQPVPPVDAQGRDMRRATLHLFDDGTYRFHEYRDPNDAACFMACLSLHHWKEAHQ